MASTRMRAIAWSVRSSRLAIADSRICSRTSVALAIKVIGSKSGSAVLGARYSVSVRGRASSARATVGGSGGSERQVAHGSPPVRRPQTGQTTQSSSSSAGFSSIASLMAASSSVCERLRMWLACISSGEKLCWNSTFCSMWGFMVCMIARSSSQDPRRPTSVRSCGSHCRGLHRDPRMPSAAQPGRRRRIGRSRGRHGSRGTRAGCASRIAAARIYGTTAHD